MSVTTEGLTPLGHALAGALGGVFSNTVVYPLDTAKTRIQASNKSKDATRRRDSMYSMLADIFRHEGIGGFYGGYTASMISTFSQQYAYFYFYSLVRTAYSKRVSRKLPPGTQVPLSVAAELSLGAAAGALCQIFTIPVSVIATRQQVGRRKDEKSSTETMNDEPDDSLVVVARSIIAEDGITGLWCGLKPGLVLTVNPAITYGVFERVKSLTLASSGKTKLTPGHSFLVGALSKTLATIVTYPYIMAKVRIQARSSEADAEEAGIPVKRDVGAMELLLSILKRDGFFGWYRGMSAQITKAVLTQGLLFMMRDQFEIFALALILLIRRLRTRSGVVLPA